MSQSALLNLSDPEVMQYSTSYLGKKFYFSLKTPMPGELGLVENLLIDRAFTNSDAAEAIGELQDISPAVPHNVLNALAAGGIARALGISPEKVQQGLKNFVLDHHRLELILDKAGIKWVNDSKATNPHAALAAILSQSSVIWIAGGLAKGSDMNDLITRGKMVKLLKQR
jgi:UDP-N-acetylmuramoylalanine--D-glutamate ligase